MITGSIVAIVTPMQEDGSLDLPRFRSLIDFHIQEGTDGIVVVGTTGESPTVNVEEHCELIRVAVEHSAGRIPVIAGTGANSTSEAIELTEFSRKAGAVAGLSVVPYYNRPTQEGMYQHFRTIAEASPLPMILYNVPGRTGMGLSADTAAALSRHPSVVGLKEASGNSTLTGEILEKTRGELPIYCGNDDQILPMMAQGSCGAISVVSNILPDKTRALTRACLERRMDDAQALQLELMPLIRALFLQVSPIPAKAALAMMGLIHDELRLPLAQMDEPYRSRLKQALLDARLLS